MDSDLSIRLIVSCFRLLVMKANVIIHIKTTRLKSKSLSVYAIVRVSIKLNFGWNFNEAYTTTCRLGTTTKIWCLIYFLAI